MQAPQRVGVVINPSPVAQIEEKMCELVFGLYSLFGENVRQFFDQNLFNETFKMENIKDLSSDMRGIFLDLRDAFQKSASKLIFKNMLIDKLRIIDPAQAYYKEGQLGYQPGRILSPRVQEISNERFNQTIEPIKRSHDQMTVDSNAMKAWKPCVVSSNYTNPSPLPAPKRLREIPDFSEMADQEIGVWACQNQLSENEVDHYLADMTLDQIQTWGFINQRSQSDIDRIIALKLHKEETEMRYVFMPSPQITDKYLKEALSHVGELPQRKNVIPRCPGSIDLSRTYSSAIDDAIEFQSKPGLRSPLVVIGSTHLLTHLSDCKNLSLLRYENLIVEEDTKAKIITCTQDHKITIKQSCQIEIVNPNNTMIEAVGSDVTIRGGSSCKIIIDRGCSLTLEMCKDCHVIAHEESIIDIVKDIGGNFTEIKK